MKADVVFGRMIGSHVISMPASRFSVDPKCKPSSGCCHRASQNDWRAQYIYIYFSQRTSPYHATIVGPFPPTDFTISAGDRSSERSPAKPWCWGNLLLYTLSPVRENYLGHLIYVGKNDPSEVCWTDKRSGGLMWLYALWHDSANFPEPSQQQQQQQ